MPSNEVHMLDRPDLRYEPRASGDTRFPPPDPGSAGSSSSGGGWGNVPVDDASVDELEQTPFGDASFADNPESRCPCVLLLDTSFSMVDGGKLDELNRGLQVFRDELTQDEVASLRVDVAVVTFGPVSVVQDWVNARAFSAPTLPVTGNTPMGEATLTALNMLEERKELYRRQGISYYRPWVFLISDGMPTDDINPAAQAVRDGEGRGAVSFFPIAVEGAAYESLRHLATRDPLLLKGTRFRDMFQWLSKSLKQVSRSQVGEDVPLEDPTAGPNGWASVKG